MQLKIRDEGKVIDAAKIDELAKFISANCPEIKGFNRRGLYRMKQFYETYKGNEFVSTLLTQSANKEDEVVEFALSRSLSPTLVSEYTLKLIDKNLLKKKLHELTEIAEIQQLSDERNFNDEK
jgi:hypothetical protein